MSTGYSNRVIRLDFPELTDDPVNDPIRVIIRNPRLMAPDELTPKDLKVTAEGAPESSEEATKESYAIFARLVIGWRVYDAKAPIELDVNGDIVGDQELLPQTFTTETIGRLPLAILQRLSEELGEAMNPQ